MAAPTVLVTYPADLDQGIPIGQSAYVIFDRGIDLEVAKKHVVLYGPDFDVTSGPDSAAWINSQGTNPFFLRSPSFKGVVDCVYSLVYLDSSNVVLSPQPVIVSEAAEVTAGYRSKLIITPKTPLAASAQYKLHVVGDPDVVGRGICSRTVFDTVAGVGNTSTTGTVKILGGHTGGNDTINIEITLAGNIGTAEYRWYYTSLGVGSAITERVTARRFRRLDNGAQIRFDGSGFALGDTWATNVESKQQLATSYTVTFTTNNGSYTAAPDSPSTPATCEPPLSVLPGSADGVDFTVVAMMPDIGAVNQPLNSHPFTITFSDEIDIATITQESVLVWVYPVSGIYQDTYDPIELLKSLEVDGNKLIIDI